MTERFIWTLGGRRISLTEPTLDDVCRRGEGRARHKTIPSLERLADKFWPKVRVDSGERCWEWAAHRDRDGYGRVSVPGTKTYLKAGPVRPRRTA